MSAKLELREISRAYPGVQALDQVAFALEAGEVHALVGENGAGKSTLIKIICGALAADTGEMLLDGRPYRPRDPRDAFSVGISTIHQELNYLPGRSAMYNILLGCEPHRHGRLDLTRMRRQSSEILRTLQAETIPLDAPAESLKAGQKQVLEIARALVRDSSLLIMDEPTAALNPQEQEGLFGVIDTLRGRGLTVLYVTHRLEEVFSLADRVTVLRDGRHVCTVPVAETSRDALISDMIGRQWAGAFPPRNEELGPPLLRVEGLTAAGAFRDVSFSLHAGEVLGITGLAGSGKEELGRALFGAWPTEAGQAWVEGGVAPSPSPQVNSTGGRQVHSRSAFRSPGEAIGCALAYIPDDRKVEGVILPLPVGRNITLPVLSRLATRLGHIHRREEARLAQYWVERLEIKTPGLGQLCQKLSGGNQQKVALAKWLASEARVLILAEPTQGIDVGVKFELYHLIAELSGAGVGIVLVSSELPEIVGLCHTVLVMRDGVCVARLSGEEIDPEKILRQALGQGMTNQQGTQKVGQQSQD